MIKWWFLKDLELEIPLDSAVPLLGIYPKDYQSFYYKDTCTHMFIVALFTIAETWNQPKWPSMIDWIKKMFHIYTMEYYVTIKRMSSYPLQGHGWRWKHHSQQTDTGTENQTPHVLIHRLLLNNENTWSQGGEHHTLGSVGGTREGTVGGGEVGRNNMGKNARYLW